MGFLFKSLQQRKDDAQAMLQKVQSKLAERTNAKKEKMEESGSFYRGKKVGKYGVY